MDVLQDTLSATHEVVLHDQKLPGSSVVKIINGHVSNRDINASLLEGPKDDQGFVELLRQPEPGQHSHLVAGYQTSTRDGKVLQSASLIYYDVADNPDAAFCINADSEQLELLGRLQCLLAPERKHTSESLDETRHTELVTETIRSVIARHKLPGQKLKKEQRRKVVSEAREQGIFKLQGGLVLLADTVGVSRVTIYNDLDALGIHL